ncbi:hypothetical protein CHO01_19990 [Cellulomonas hominis]|uniref:Uncharacterized protein YcnI n=1 Tax=Cellulomonas hominis TaxID=156981 RepID=A0A511FCF3_9CELL|nr:YcnI family protein [Cellulomonas hominis]MBB5471797.1 uncharacterized protein YcnI [Cellulomonas hominis]GEL46883.1 hypothetical protein CHO01_19990 [Cellulomonas hominis]
MPAHRTRLAAGTALAATLVLLPAGGASAHVRVVPEATAAGGWTVLTFRVPNESATAATTSVTVDLPTGTPLTSVSTRPLPGWTATVEEGDLPEPVDVGGATITRAPVRVVWTADGEGIRDGEFQELELSVGPLPEAGTRLVLPAHQGYSDGTVVDWDETTDDGTEPEHPAPELTTTEAADTHGGHGAPEAAADAGSDGDADAGSDGDADAGTGAATATPDAWGRTLGALGLAAGAAALVVALRTRTRVRRP